MANPHPTRSRFSGGKLLPSRKARSTRALLILFGTPCLRAGPTCLQAGGAGDLPDSATLTGERAEQIDTRRMVE